MTHLPMVTYFHRDSDVTDGELSSEILNAGFSLSVNG